MQNKQLTNLVPLLEHNSLQTTSDRATEIRAVKVIREALAGGSITRLSQSEPDKVALYLALELEQVAKVYTGAPNTDATVYDEAAVFVFEKFGFLGLNEIREAFRHAAANAPDILAAYYGQFTNAMLGRVLGVYCEQVRNQVARKIAEELPESVQAAFDLNYYELAEKTIHRLCALEEVTFDSVTIGDYGILEKAGRLTLTAAQKWEYWGKAEAVTDARLHAAKNRETNAFALRLIAQQIEQGEANDRYLALREATAKRMVTVDFINSLKNDNQQG